MEVQNESLSMLLQSSPADRVIDITADLCPMTFVRTRLALDGLVPGQTLLVLLRGDEPRENVPRTAVEQGHAVLAAEHGADGITRLLLRKGKEGQGSPSAGNSIDPKADQRNLRSATPWTRSRETPENP